MIIQSSEVSMASRRTYYSKLSMEQTISTTPVLVLGGITVSKPQGEDKTAGANEGGDFLSSMNYYMDKSGSVKEVGDVAPNTNDSVNTRIQFQTLSYLLRLLLGEKLSGQNVNLSDAFSDLFAQSNQVMQTTSTTYEYVESETTSFSAIGVVNTADGRQLEFNYSMEMSRCFKESYSSIVKEVRPINFCDPLVINLDSNPTEISDQHFYFDLNMDGEDEEICMLSPNSGLLAIDLDGDGTITNGGELFGARTGDGFYELAAYDEDGNGWIDEADSIFSKLRVWTFDEKGNSQLTTLKQSDVGAIYLHRVPSEFTCTDDDNIAVAKLRSSGIYLKESTGQAASIQHVDFAM